MLIDKILIERKKILESIPNDILYSYIINNLKKSLASIGFSFVFIEDLLNNFKVLNFENFYSKHSEEIKKIYDIGFFQKIVPNYFLREVVPEIPASKVLVDIGCGTGILLHSIESESKFKQLIGIDIREYEEWKKFNSKKVTLKIVTEKKFGDFLNEIKPDNVVLTWTLHHMDFSEQERYLKDIFNSIPTGSKLVILEDSFSQFLRPKNGEDIFESFIRLSEKERRIVMSFYDWMANRILARREHVPIPFSYRTLEEWEKICNEVGYFTTNKVFIGFPEKRDINTPQSLLVLQK